jgi:hypothetical protein
MIRESRPLPCRNGGVESVVTTNKVIRNTYLLLSMTLLFRCRHRRALVGAETAASRA